MPFIFHNSFDSQVNQGATVLTIAVEPDWVLRAVWGIRYPGGISGTTKSCLNSIEKFNNPTQMHRMDH